MTPVQEMTKNQATGLVSRHGSQGEDPGIFIFPFGEDKKDSLESQQALETSYGTIQDKKYLFHHIDFPKCSLISPWEALFIVAFFPSVLIKKDEDFCDCSLQ